MVWLRLVLGSYMVIVIVVFSVSFISIVPLQLQIITIISVTEVRDNVETVPWL